MLEPRYYHLGWRVYLLFFLRQGRWFILNLFLLILILAIRIIVVLPDSITPLMVYQVTMGVLLLLPITLIIGIIGAWIQYLAYEFCLDEHALKIKSGIIGLREDAIPYRQMQDVDIKRDVLFRLLGLSRLTILTAGTEDSGDVDDESKGIIPAIDKKLASWLQETLLQRANIERIAHHQEEI